MALLYPGPTTENLVCIPDVLKARRQFVLWRGLDRIDQHTGVVTLNKMPLNPYTLLPADSTDPATWGTFEQCVQALPTALEGWEQEHPALYRGGGIGFVFTQDDPYTGIDLDHCVDPDTGMIAAWAQAYITALSSYTEITPSGTGVHILVEGSLPPRGRKKGPVEMYSTWRFFTLTGWHLPDTPAMIEARHDALLVFHAAIFGPPRTTAMNGHAPHEVPPPLLDDVTLLSRAQHARNGAKVQALWSGDTAGYASQSEADLALCMVLAFWTTDVAQIDRLFRQSALLRDKWDAPRGQTTYGAITITEALARQTEHFSDHATLVVDPSPSWHGSLPHAPAPLAPLLPSRASPDPRLAEQAAPWLDAYITYSLQWSPRAAQGFHQAVGLWILSTIAARRICVEMGRPYYPSLFMALLAPSSLYAKTTTAQLGRQALYDAGCSCFLAADRATPQALLRSMSGRVPADYGTFNEDEQLRARQRLAFAGQRGWYFEEWGGMLHQMMRRDSPMAVFHELLRVLDDGQSDFASDTIQRGYEGVEQPYLSLLASATPHDLHWFTRPGTAWWHDGFWPRFTFIVPLPQELPSLTRRPWGLARLPASLIVQLHDWHKRLGVPEVTVEPAQDARGKPTGAWRATRTPLHCHLMTPDAAVQDAYYAYDDALRQLIINGDAPNDLRASYSRFHDKAMRVAMLLASCAGTDTITLSHWTYAQQVTEHWRTMLHQTLQLVAEGQPLSREEELEQRIESLVARDGPRTARELRQTIWGHSSTEIQRALMAMVQIERLVCVPQGKTKRYGLPIDIDAETYESGEQNSENW
jgi:hypothetical protein